MAAEVRVLEMDFLHAPVAAGLRPAVEPGILPGGQNARPCKGLQQYPRCWNTRTLDPGGKMPPSTSGTDA